MPSMSIVRVYDAKTKKLKRIETAKGQALAVVRDGKLKCTPLGTQQGYVIRNNKMVGYRSGLEPV